ncbi:carbohydrate-binding protein, partial [uncultured Salinicola sp.]|uniref:carbohydrate-binding protein n=1 Tax=uncultured Salinicola sp. TaxID=1193542 RepID=UPI00260DC8F0
VEQDGATYTSAAPHAVTNTGGWNNYQANDGIELDLSAGEQTLRLTFNGGAMNLQSFTLTPENTLAVASPMATRMASEGDSSLMQTAELEGFVPSDDVAVAGVDHPDTAGLA